jgi:hypothetical protein
MTKLNWFNPLALPGIYFISLHPSILHLRIGYGVDLETPPFFTGKLIHNIQLSFSEQINRDACRKPLCYFQ